jgi:hypothetical protein
MNSKSASEEGRLAMKALASKLEKTVALWRTRLREQTAVRSGAAATDIDAAQSDLREQLAALEDEAMTMQKHLDREVMAAAQWEQRAMAAVARNDDGTAREALEHQERHSEAAAALQAELTLLHAMQQVCRDVLENVYYRAGARSNYDVEPPSNEEL